MLKKYIAGTPATPYYAVIFTSQRTAEDKGYTETAEKMIALASEQPGFLGVESAREEIGVTVSYWSDLATIQRWKENIDHQRAQKEGRERWYTTFQVRIAKVERDYRF